jgi:hypothetical protein
MDEAEDWHSTFEGVNFDGKPTDLTVFHHLDSGGLSIIIDGAEEKTCYLNSDEWLRLSDFLLTKRNVRDWIDKRKEDRTSKEIMRRLELFGQMGLQGRDLLQATMLPKDE